MYTKLYTRIKTDIIHIIKENPDMLNSINKPQNLRKQVYERLKKGIVTHKLYPGMKLDEKQISEMLGVSRTPIREAFARLDQEGLVDIEPRRGVFVSRITVQDLIDVLYMREVLEGLAARLFTAAAEKEDVERLKEIMQPFARENLDAKINEYNLANVEFHNYVLDKSKNTRLVSTMHNMYDHLSMAKMLKIIRITGRAKKSLKEHRRIIEVIEKRDAQQAEFLMRKHISLLRNDIIDNLDKIKEQNLNFVN